MTRTIYLPGDRTYGGALVSFLQRRHSLRVEILEDELFIDCDDSALYVYRQVVAAFIDGYKYAKSEKQ